MERRKRRRKPFHEVSSKIRLEKKSRSSTQIATWDDLFTNKIFALAFISNTDLINVVDLACTSKRLYRFYFGDGELTPKLCKAVEDQYRMKYKSPPLKYLGPAFNCEKIINTEGIVKYRANRCADCFKKLGDKDIWPTIPFKYIHCHKCAEKYKYFKDHVIPVILIRISHIYYPSQIKRISRIMRRHGVSIGKRLEKEFLWIGLPGHVERIREKAISIEADLFMELLSKLDLELLPINIPPPMIWPLPTITK